MQFEAPTQTKTNRFRKILLFGLIFGLSLLSIGLTIQQYRHAQTASKKAFSLVSAASIDQARVSINKDKVAYNSSQDESLQSKLTIDGAEDGTGEFPYQVELPKEAADGTTFADAKGDLPFKAIPLGNLADGQYSDGHMTYGQNPKVSHVVTLKKNGIKEDILLSQPIGDSFTFSWRLELGSKLEAKLMSDGSVGIYAASPYLYGNLQIADDKSKDLVEKARSGEKNYLAFILPAPYIAESSTDGVESDYQNVKYTLKDNVLTLTATNLNSKTYPLSIDPSTVVVNTTTSFISGRDDGGITYGGNQISRNNTGIGSVGAWSTSSNYFSFPRSYQTSVAYKGFLYVIGGYEATADNNCKNTGESINQCNDTQYAQINSDGSIGTWFTSANYFSVPRYGHSSFAYNGYIYITGGLTAGATTSCKNSGSSTRCNDVQYAAVNADGSIGAWATNTNYFSIPRYGQATAVYNGFLYITGGLQSTSDTNCKNSGTNQYCNDVQYAPINADGSIGTFTTNTNYFSVPRYWHGAVAYNGYLYVLGGQEVNNDTACKDTGTNTQCKDIQYAVINSDGSVGAFTTSNNYLYTTRSNFTTYAYGGYIYVVGGQLEANSTYCKNSSYGTSIYCHDIIFAPVLTTGNTGVWTTSYRTQNSTTGTGDYISFPRYGLSSAIYNGYLYVQGGFEVASDTNCKSSGTNQYCSDTQYAKFNIASPTETSGSVSGTNYFGATRAWSTTANYFATPRYYHSSVAYNGYLYVMGGLEVASDTACKNTGVGSTYCNDVQYAPINADGTVGSWNATSYFSIPRAYMAAVAYNGYMYIIGGQEAASNTSCKDSGTSNVCNDVQYATINANGTLGSFANTSYFSIPRYGLSAVTSYNGYLYITGGIQASSNANCKNTNAALSTYCNDTQYALINANGTLGSFTTSTNYFNTPRAMHISAAYNGYLYVIGGQEANSDTACKDSGTSNACNDIWYAQLNSNGSIGSWVLNPNYFLFPRWAQAVATNNGVIYLISGTLPSASTNCKSSTNNVYCNDVQYAQFRPGGAIGSFQNSSNYISIPRYGTGAAIYGTYLYSTGGLEYTSDTNCKNSGTNQYCNDTQYSFVTIPTQKGNYEKLIDLGSVVSNVSSIVFNGTSICGVTMSYATAASNGVFGSSTVVNSAMPGTSYTINAASKRYVLVKFLFNDENCGGVSTITDITINYFQTPAAPTLTSPSSGATGVSRTPVFTFRTTDADSDYLQYRLYVYASDCSTPVGSSPFAQASSQTGWSGQDRENFTAYAGAADISSSTLATYTYQGTLSYNTTYCWKADAIDPGGTNTYSSASSTRTFTTLANTAPAAPTLTQPLDTQTGTLKAPQFRLSASDADSDYLKYKIEVCTTSNCSSVLRTIDQTSSQTGWLAQSQQSGTAYGSGQLAAHNYQTPELTANTQYWWRAYAIDPGGTNTFSSASSIFSFTTGTGVGDDPYQGGVIIGQ